MAEQVTRMPGPLALRPIASLQVNRKCAPCAEEDAVQRKPGPAPPTAGGQAPPQVCDVLDTPGQALDPASRAFFEPRFGQDFSTVRVHSDGAAAESARAIGALGYAAGRHLVFDENFYQPQTESGRRLLAHELAHVVQQTADRGASTIRRGLDPTGGTNTRAARPSGGAVLFVQVDRSANTITFVTESGSLSYRLLTPTEIPAGAYTFAVSVTGANLDLQAPAEITTKSTFRYAIPAEKPNPAKLLTGKKTVTVQVIEGGGGPPGTGNAAAPPTQDADPIGFKVQVLTPEAFKSMTGLSADALKEGALVSGASLSPSAIAAGAPSSRPADPASPYPDRSGGAGLLPGVGAASVLTRFPSYPIPANATGVLWTQIGAGHFSEFANVGGNFGARGFRYDLWMNLFPGLRETGLPGSFQNDFLFTLLPNQTIVYRSTDQAAAAAFADRLLATKYDQTYQFPPRPGSDVAVCGKNCITTPAAEVVEALGVKPEILTPDGPVNILEQGRPSPGAPFEPSQAGRGATMREWLGQDDAYFAERGLTRMKTPIFTPAARGGVAFIKVGGAIMMIYGAYKTAKRIRDTPSPERPRVVAEETGSWVGGALGSALGAAGAAALVCLPAGPVDFICVAGGFVGGLIGGAVGGGLGGAAGGAAFDFIGASAEEAYLNAAKAAGDPIPPAAQPAVDQMLGDPIELR